MNLFPAEPFLEQRLGSEAFQHIPDSPGIYRFYDCEGRLLYVGKSLNLRRRLFGYKRARAGSVSRKVSEMISRIHRFELELTRTEEEALLLENRWIRENRPPYNHANKETETYYFVYLHPGDEALEFRLAMRIHEETERKYWYGCFKGHAPVRKSFGCLLRLLWMAEYGIQNPMHLPVQLTRKLTPMRWRMPWSKVHSPSLHNRVRNMLRSWIRGESCEILDWFIVQIECDNRLTLFSNLHLEYHLDCLKRFYDRKLALHRKMRGEEQLIMQDKMDDLRVLHGRVRA
jgi:hypothetical protein